MLTHTLASPRAGLRPSELTESPHGQIAGSHREDVIPELPNIVSEISPAKIIQYQHSDLHPCFKEFPQNKGHCFDNFSSEFRKAEATKCGRSGSQFIVSYSHCLCFLCFATSCGGAGHILLRRDRYIHVVLASWVLPPHAKTLYRRIKQKLLLLGLLLV